MATGGVRRIYEEDDEVDEYLLNQLSKWIIYDHLGTLARDLGMSQAEFSRIVAIGTNQPLEQIFKVRDTEFSRIREAQQPPDPDFSVGELVEATHQRAIMLRRY